MRRSFLAITVIIFTLGGVAMVVAGQGVDRIIGIVAVLLFGFGGVGYFAGQLQSPDVAVRVADVAERGRRVRAVTLPARPAKWLPMTIGTVGMGAGCVLLGIYADAVVDPGTSPWMLRIIGLAGGALFLVVAAGSLAGATNGMPSLVLGSEGVAMSAGFGRSFVPWEIVAEVGVYEMSVRGWSHRFAAIRATDASRIEIPGWLRWLAAANRRMSGWDVTYPETMFDLDAEQITELVDAFVNRPAVRTSASSLPTGDYSYDRLMDHIADHRY